MGKMLNSIFIGVGDCSANKITSDTGKKDLKREQQCEKAKYTLTYKHGSTFASSSLK